MRFLNKVVVGSLVIIATSASGSSLSICDPRQILSKPAWEGTSRTIFGLLPQEIKTLVNETNANESDRMLLCDLILTYKHYTGFTQIVGERLKEFTEYLSTPSSARSIMETECGIELSDSNQFKTIFEKG